MTHHDSDLSYGICNTINDNSEKRNHHPLLIFQPNLISRKKRFKMFLDNFIWFIVSNDSVLSLFECITTSSSMFLVEIKLVAIAN